MDKDPETPIRLRPDGSIDTVHYMAIGRLRRAEQAHALAKDLSPAKPARRAMGALRAAFASLSGQGARLIGH